MKHQLTCQIKAYTLQYSHQWSSLRPHILPLWSFVALYIQSLVLGFWGCPGKGNDIFFYGQHYIPQSLRGCSEIERQNLQTSLSDELIGVHRWKRQWVVCCICKQNSQHLCDSSNRPCLDKKQVLSQTNERNEMWQRSYVQWIPLIVTPKGRKKEARSDIRNGLPQSSKWTQTCLACAVAEVQKTEAWPSLGVQFVGWGLWHMQILPSQNWYKRSNLSIVGLLHCYFTIGLSKWKRQDRLPAGKVSIRIHFLYNLPAISVLLEPWYPGNLTFGLSQSSAAWQRIYQ